jgi:hypothetical protein
MSLRDDIKKQSQGIPVSGTESLIIEQALNKLFYVTPNYPLELKMLKMQKQQKQQAGDRYGLHLSAIIASEDKFCFREQVLSLFYKQDQGENVPIKLKRIFKAGDMIGEKWQRMFVSGGVGEIEDMDISRFVEEYDLSYTPDAVITICGKRRVQETKSMNTFQFKHATSHPSGRKQLRMYMYFERCKNGHVLVEDKNDQSIKVFPEVWKETFGPDDLEPYIIRLDKIQKYKRDFKKRKVMPDRICNKATCKRAAECNMRDACWNIGMGRVKLDV